MAKNMIKDISIKAKHIRTKIKSNEANKELIINSSVAFIVRIGGAIASFLMNVAVARYLGIDDSGDFFLALAIITIVATIVRMGGDNAILRFVGIHGPKKEWVEVRGVMQKMVYAVLVFSCFITILLLVNEKFIATHVFNNPALENTFFWMFLAIPFYAIYTLYSIGLQALKKVLFSVALQNIAVPFLLIIFVFIYSPQKADDLSKFYLISSVITLGISLFVWRFFVPNGRALFDKNILWKSCYPLWVMAILQQTIQWSGQFIAGMFSDNVHLAQLAIAQRTSMLITFIGIAINLVSAPKFAHFYSEGKLHQLKKYSKNTTKLMALFSSPLMIFVWFFPQEVMSLFGKGFENGYWMLRILSLGQFINVMTGSVGYLLMMSGHEKDMRNITFVSGFLSIFLNIILIKYFGAMGAAIAIATSVATLNLLALKMVKKRLGFSTFAITN
jgi:O-antigen/teichoic acid export membrane protein